MRTFGSSAAKTANPRRLRCTVVSRRLVRAVREERGSALVEFAASAVLLFTLVFGIMDCSRALYIDHFVANAAREATRYATVRGSSWTSNCTTAIAYGCIASSSNVASFVQLLATSGINPADITTTTSWPGTDATGASCTGSGPANSLGCVVVVKVSYSFSFMVPFLPKNALVLSSTSKVTIAQ
jgi:Flp pilus assembly protein TadG